MTARRAARACRSHPQLFGPQLARPHRGHRLRDLGRRRPGRVGASHRRLRSLTGRRVGSASAAKLGFALRRGPYPATARRCRPSRSRLATASLPVTSGALPSSLAPSTASRSAWGSGSMSTGCRAARASARLPWPSVPPQEVNIVGVAGSNAVGGHDPRVSISQI